VQVVAANGLSADQGGPVSIVQGKVEEVQDIGMDKVGAAACGVACFPRMCGKKSCA
jgi:hypothetical protein